MGDQWVLSFLRPDAPGEIDPPTVILGLVKSQALERNGDLDLPPSLCDLALDMPDGIPVPVVAAPVASGLGITLGTLRIGVEKKSIAVVIKSIQDDSKLILFRTRKNLW